MKYRIRKVYFAKDEIAVFYADRKSKNMIAWRSSNALYTLQHANHQISAWKEQEKHPNVKGFDIVEEEIVFESE